MLIIVTGLPGSGKTYFSKALSEEIKAHHINSDKTRKVHDLMGMYDDTSKNKVYFEMLLQMMKLLKQNEHVIIDATFYKRRTRNLFIDIAALSGHSVKVIQIKASTKTVEERVSKKRALSEADVEVYQKIKAIYEPLEIAHLILWSDKMDLKEMLAKTVDYTLNNEQKSN